MKISRGKIILILLLMSVSVSILLYSFAYTTVSKTGNITNYLTVSNISFGLVDSVESINLGEVVPTLDKFGVLNDAFNFSIVNNGTSEQKYTVRLIDKTLSTISNDEIRYQLTKNGVAGEIKDLSSSGLIDAGVIAGSGSVDYSIKVWLKYDAVTLNGVWDKVVKVEAGGVNIDSSGANEPILLDNMIPVYYDENNNVWKKADRLNVDNNYRWYDYDARMWANAVTLKKYGEFINENQTVSITKPNITNYTFTSGNKGVNSSTSDMTLTITSTINATFTMEYSVSSESNYDKFTLSLNGTVDSNINGISGTKSGTYTLNMTAGETYTIYVKYVKDVSDSSGDDQVILSTIIGNDIVLNISNTGSYPWSVSESEVGVTSKYSATYNYDESTRLYTLSNPVESDISSAYVNKYVCGNVSVTTCGTIYKVKTVSGTTITSADIRISSLSLDFYNNAELGREIPYDYINAFFVWIPRFKYNSFESGSQKMVDITFEKGVYSTGTGNSYTHSAFSFNGKETTGFWVSKFELSPEENTTCYRSVTSANCNISNLALVSKPNLKSLYNISISNLFKSIRNMELDGNIHGFKNGGANLNDDGTGDDDDTNNYDIHLIKSFENGALTYLTYSKYGKYGDVRYDENSKYIFSNNSNTKTGSSYVDGKTYSYNDDYYGTGASTTGNVYGVYDLNGLVKEFVMGNVLDSSGLFNASSSGFSTSPNLRYYDGYPYTSSSSGISGINGDGIKDFIGFESGSSTLPYYSYPFLLRETGTKFNRSNGSTSSNVGGRSVITVEQDIYIIK